MKPSVHSHKESSKSAKQPLRSKHDKDIIGLITEDHKPLKHLIETLKDPSVPVQERQGAFEEFAALLTIHAKAEEQVLYVFMKKDEELRTEGFEGDVEHGLAEQLVDEIRNTQDENLWSARVKVLAELVEHHIEEEEDELLPDFKKGTNVETRERMGAQYLERKEIVEKDEIEVAQAEDGEGPVVTH